MPNILITGASGFLGGRTASYFAQIQQFEVRATSRSNKKADALTELGCDFMQGDLIDSKFVAELVEGIDIVVHCAALTSKKLTLYPRNQSIYTQKPNSKRNNSYYHTTGREFKPLPYVHEQSLVQKTL